MCVPLSSTSSQNKIHVFDDEESYRKMQSSINGADFQPDNRPPPSFSVSEDSPYVYFLNGNSTIDPSVVKIVSPRMREASAENETLMLEAIDKIESLKPGVAELIDLYYLKGKDGSITHMTSISKNGGKDLLSFLTDPTNGCHKQLPEESVRSIGYKIFTLLDYLHKNNKVHRDLKPENILYCEETDTVRLIDFGHGADLNQNRPIFGYGTTSYMAPEAILGLGEFYKQELPKVDVFSSGIILFVMATGALLAPSPCLYKDLIGSNSDLAPEDYFRLSTYLHLYGIQQALGSFPRIYHPNIQQKGYWDQGSIPWVFNKTQFGRDTNNILKPLSERVPISNPKFLSLLKWVLALDPTQRPTAAEVRNHEFFREVHEPYLKMHPEDQSSENSPPTPLKVRPRPAPLQLQEVLKKQQADALAIDTPTPTNIPKGLFPTVYPPNGGGAAASNTLDLDTPIPKNGAQSTNQNALDLDTPKGT